MDSLEGHRAQLMAALEGAIAAGSRAAKARARNQLSLFGGADEEDGLPPPDLPEVPRWPEPEQLQLEKEALGFYVSSHPLARYAELIHNFSSTSSGRLADVADGTVVVIGGLIASLRLGNTRKGDRFARVALEDLEGTVNAVVWPNVYEECREALVEDAMVFFRAKVDQAREKPELKVDEVVPFDEALERLSGAVHLKLECQAVADGTLDALVDLLRAHRGECPLFLSLRTAEGRRVFVKAGPGHQVRPSSHLAREMEKLLGEGHLSFTPAAAS
jgi:DNA polymerase-3 subunit alpha